MLSRNIQTLRMIEIRFQGYLEASEVSIGGQFTSKWRFIKRRSVCSDVSLNNG